MKNINIVEMLNLAEGDVSTNRRMIVIGAKSSFSQIQDAVIECLHDSDIYLENEEMLSTDDKSYSPEQLSAVVEIILYFCSKNQEEKTFWFDVNCFV